MGRSFDPLPSGQIMIFPGWWYTYPSEKYESQLGLLFRIYGKIKANVPNHQPDIVGYIIPLIHVILIKSH
jgi:hypothetical protein